MSNDNSIDNELFDYFDDKTETLVEVDKNDNVIEHVDSVDMNEQQAREITESIKAASVAVYVLIAKAHEGKAYKALGYSSFEEYVNTEFDLSRNRAYQLLNLSNTIKAIESVTPEGTEVKLTEIQARDIKRELPKITERIKEETSGYDKDDSEDIVQSIIEEERGNIKQEKENAHSVDNENTGSDENTANKWHNDGSGTTIIGEEGNNREKDYQDGKKKEWEDNYKDTDGNDTNSYVNNVDSALNSSYDDEEKEDYGVGQWKEDASHTRPAAMKTEDVAFFMDFVEKVESFPSVHNFLSSLTTDQRKILSRKAMSASDYLNELMDELAIGEMNRA